MIRFGLVGCGWIAEREHVPAMRAASGVEVVGVADMVPERARLVGESLGLSESAYRGSPEELIERSDVDAISIATPPNHRRELVLAAAAAGKHVLCEKPIATTLADADAMIDACARAGVKFSVYHNYLYYPETILARELIASGAIGDVLASELNGYGARPWVGTEAYRPGWRYEIAEAGGGALIDMAIHAIYLTEAYHGRPIRAVSAAVRYEDGIDLAGFCRLDLGGSVGLVNVAWGHGGGSLRIIGGGGHIEFVFDENMGYYGGPARGVRCVAEGEPARTWYMAPGRMLFSPAMFEDIAATLEGSRDAYPVTGADGRRGLEVILAAYRSASTRDEVSLPLPVDSLYTQGLVGLADQVPA